MSKKTAVKKAAKEKVNDRKSLYDRQWTSFSSKSNTMISPNARQSLKSRIDEEFSSGSELSEDSDMKSYESA
jgi:hypothetical protein